MSATTHPSPTARVEVRDLDTSDDAAVLAWLTIARRALLDASRVTSEHLAPARRRWVGHRVSAGVLDGRVVGTFRSWDVDLPVPGGTCRTDLVSSVAVAATHRRRGVLSAMMRSDLDAAVERGTPLALLVAAEAPIYGRFGFAPAVEARTLVVDTRPGAADLVPSAVAAAGDVELELVDEAALRALAPAVHARVAAASPGSVPRHASWWDTELRTVPTPGKDLAGAVHGLVARDGAGRPVGYARYHVDDSWGSGTSAAVLHVDDLAAVSPAAYAGLWRTLLTTDLVRSVRAAMRPAVEPLPWLLRDRRALQVEQPWDLLWARVLDPAAALSSRRAGAPGEGVLEVVDPGGPAGGRWAWHAGDDGALSAEPTSAAADLTLPVQALGSALLGQVPLGLLAVAGQVAEHRGGAVARLAASLAWTPTAFPTLTSF